MDEKSLNRHQTTGTFSNSDIKPEDSTIPLHVLLTFPIFWKPSKIVNFFQDSWNQIKEPDSRKQEDEKAQIKQFQEMLQNESNLALPPGKPDWKAILGETHWEALQRRGADSNKQKKSLNEGSSEPKNRKRNSSGGYKSQYVNHLLRLIRNQLQHLEQRSDEERILLGWFSNNDLDESKFVNYWTSRFPKLVLFLWWKFYEFKDRQKIQQYYYHSLDHYNLEKLSWNEETVIPDLTQAFHEALKTHCMAGGLSRRFKCTLSGNNSTGSIIEFRCLKENTISNLLDGCSYIRIEVRENGFYITRPNAFRDDDDVSSSSLQFLDFNNDYNKQSKSKLVVNVVSNNCEHNKMVVASDTYKTVILADTDSVNQLAQKFATVNHVIILECPITWAEVKPSQSTILQFGKLSLQKYDNDEHRKIFNLKDVLPSDIDEAESILKYLQCQTLNTLLKGSPAILMCKHELSKVSPEIKYLPRRLCSRKEVSSKVLRHRCSDVFLVTGISKEALYEKINENETVHLFEQSLDNLEENIEGRIFLVENDRIDYDQMVAKFKDRFRSFRENLHVLAYYKDDLFKWLHSYGSMKIITMSFPKKAEQLVVLNEDEFVKNIHSNTAGKTSPVFIIDKPGMGKSLLLKSLANQVYSNCPNSLVVLFNMSDVVEKLKHVEKSNSTDDIKFDIIKLIQQELCGNSEESFEGVLLRYLLLKQSSQIFTLELFLDGLDEVDKKLKSFAIKILKVIRQELYAVRLWVTCREYMQSEVEKEFNVLCYKISPFSSKDMIQFLQNYWLQSGSKLSNRVNLNDILHNFATFCVTQTNTEPLAIEIAGAPLQCRMIAEIYEDKLPDIISGTLSAPENKFLITLYESMVDKHIKVYLKDKRNMSDVKDDDMTIIFTRNHIQPWHMYYACKLIFSDWDDSYFSLHLNVNPDTTTDIVTYGIVENLDPPRFIHRTYAEYFVALFIYKALVGEFRSMSNSQLEMLRKLVVDEVFEGVKRQFSHDAQTHQSINISALNFFLNEMLTEDSNVNADIVKLVALNIHDFRLNDDIFKTDKSVLFTMMQENYFSLAKTLLEAIGLENRNQFLQKTKQYHNIFLEVLVRSSDVHFFMYITKLLDSWCLAESNENFAIGPKTFKLALVKGNFSIAKFLIEEKGYGLERWKELRKNKKSLGVVHFVLSKSRHDSSVILENKKTLLKYLVQINRQVLEERDDDGGTPILFNTISVSFELKAFLVKELGANVNATGKFHNTVLHWKHCSNYANAVTPSQYHDMLEFYLKNGFTQINLANIDMCTPLMCAVKTYGNALLPKTLDLFKKANADFNTKDKNGNTVLDLCNSNNDCKAEFIQKLTDCECESNFQL